MSRSRTFGMTPWRCRRFGHKFRFGSLMGVFESDPPECFRCHVAGR